MSNSLRHTPIFGYVSTSAYVKKVGNRAVRRANKVRLEKGQDMLNRNEVYNDLDICDGKVWFGDATAKDMRK